MLSRHDPPQDVGITCASLLRRCCLHLICYRRQPPLPLRLWPCTACASSYSLRERSPRASSSPASTMGHTR